MKSCWEGNPDDRPHFSELVTKLVHFLGSISDYFDLVIKNSATEEQQCEHPSVSEMDPEVIEAETVAAT